MHISKLKTFASPLIQSAFLAFGVFLILYLLFFYGILSWACLIIFPFQVFLVCMLIFHKKKNIRSFLEERYEQLIPFYQNFEEGILFLDKNFKAKVYNLSFCRIVGLKAYDIKNRPFLKIEEASKKEALDKCKQLLEKCRTFKNLQKEILYYKKQEIPFSIEISVCKISEEEYLIILKDSFKEGASFNMGKDFIANASHELRTPITIIKGFVETLKEMPEISEAMLEDIFDKILRSCVRMDSIVKKLLLLTDLEHLSKARTNEVNLLALLENCRHTLLGIYPTADVSIQAETKEVYVQADGDLLEVAVMNLLQNAVKYSNAPAKISLTIENETEDHLIHVADRGIGIAEENRPHLFDRFYTVDKTVSRKLGGAGLGLSIVKAIIDKHHGEVLVKDNPFGGTVFTLKIPKK